MLFDYPDNILPKDGDVSYFPEFLSADIADGYFNALLNNLDWLQDEAIMYGKHIQTKRKFALHADKPYRYGYSQIKRTALPWTEDLLTLRQMIQDHAGEAFNTCLLNLYHNGNEGMSWHSDAEKELKQNGVIASLSLGAERKFMFKHKVSKETIALPLAHGSLLIMKGQTQTHWLHSVPKTTQVSTARINLTFRQMKD